MKYYVVSDSSDFVGFTKNISLAVEYLKTITYRNAEYNLPCDPKMLEIECSSTVELVDHCYAQGIVVYSDDDITVYRSSTKFIDAHIVGTASDLFVGENSLVHFLEKFVVREDISYFRKVMHFVLWLKGNNVMRDEKLLKSILRCTQYLIDATDLMLNQYDEYKIYLDIDEHIDLVMYGIWKKWWVNING